MDTEQQANMSLLKAQFGIFFKNPIARPDLLTRKIADEFDDYFDSAPINLPIPAEILEFPVAQLKSSNNRWQVNVSRIRADVIFNPDEKQNYADLQTESEKIVEILLKLVDEVVSQKVDVTRVTNISNFFKITESPTQDLQKLYFKKENAKISELMIRLNEPIFESNLSCNNLVQFETGQAVNIKEGRESMGILITRDFNTDPKKKDTFTKKEIEDFIKIAAKHSHTPMID